jgi:hypothetical protein
MAFKSYSVQPETAEVRKAQKSIHYTVTDIADIGQWRKEQAEQEALYQAKMITVRAKWRQETMAVVAGDAAPMPLTKCEQAEIDYVIRRAESDERFKKTAVSDAVKYYVNTTKHNERAAESVRADTERKLQELQFVNCKPSMISKIKSWLGQVWSAANLSS